MILNALLASACLVPSQEPAQVSTALLPPGPEGWGEERLEFPLSFAPELGSEGFEELRFAPGMFASDSDGYFSYAFAIRFARDVVVDARFLESTLETYYKGLCRAVGESRGLEVDKYPIAASVVFDGKDWSATIDMFDPFVTGGPLKLALELSVQPGARTTDILGLASPSPADSEVWKELHGIRRRWRAALTVPVLLNHVFVVPDQATFDAIAQSRFLRDTFAVFEERATVRGDMSYSGIYFYGDHTYFEFLPPQKTGELALGASGVAFGIETVGGTASVAALLEARGIRSFAGPVTREVDGAQVPWFQIMGIEKPTTTSKLNLFSLEYDPAFLARWHPGSAPASSDIEHRNIAQRGIARASVLARYAASLGVRERPFADVTRVHLELDEAERGRLLEVCRAFDYEVTERDGRWICDGPGCELTIRGSETPGRVTGFELALREPLEHEPLRLGKALVRFAGATAVFEFE